MQICDKCQRTIETKKYINPETKNFGVCINCFFDIINQKGIKYYKPIILKEIDRARISLYVDRILYYEYNKPVLNDYIYDKTEKECIRLESLINYNQNSSPTRHVGNSIPNEYKTRVNSCIAGLFQVQQRYNELNAMIEGLNG